MLCDSGINPIIDELCVLIAVRLDRAGRNDYEILSVPEGRYSGVGETDEETSN